MVTSDNPKSAKKFPDSQIYSVILTFLESSHRPQFVLTLHKTSSLPEAKHFCLPY